MPPARPADAIAGVVLHVRNVGEGHRLVEAWLDGLGRTPLWARGARASRRRFGAALQPFASLTFMVQQHGSMARLQAAEIVQERAGIRESLPRIARAANVVTLVRALFAPGQDVPEVRPSLEVALDHVAAGRPERAAGLYPRLAHASGILPDLMRCGGCGRPGTAETLGSGPTVPHLVCASCEGRMQPLGAALHAALGGARVVDAACAERLEQLVVLWAGLHVGRPIALWPRAPWPEADERP